MKFGLCISVLTLTSAVTVPCATAQSKQAQNGTIVSVQKREVTTPPIRPGADPVRTPVQSHYYVYNTSVQLNCEVYDGRYESQLDDLPDSLAANNHVPVRIDKNLMYLDFPGNTVKMRIVRHKVSDDGACTQSALGK
jgi:hypothetical protein